ncbi:MAG TPA: Mbeg1-like protein [Clostridium sp.]
MCKLTYEELILLDNLIYLKFNAKEDERLIDIVNKILTNEVLDNIGDCSLKMTKSEWINILEQIINKPNLRKLRMKNIDNYKSGMRFACFVDEKDNVTVVFRGTATIKEWDDNGKGAYEFDTLEQIDALNYINSLEYNDITVTGHSKGGNKAQYVTVLSPKIMNCISVNGQGFSNEFINKYKEEININKSKIIGINSKYDYVNCLFNSIEGKCHYIQTDFQINPLYYHKCNILLNENGVLKQNTNEATISKIIKDFSISLISDLPEDIQNLIINGIIGVIELVLCKGESKDNILKVAGEFFIMLCYEDCLIYKEIFNTSYVVLEALILPLLFWEDFVNIEETKSEELLDKVITRINILGNGMIKKLEIIDKDEMNLIKSISKAITTLTFKLENETL